MGEKATGLSLPSVLQPGNRALTELAYRHGISFIILFGSRAKGTARPTSDHDLAVMMDNLTAGEDPLPETYAGATASRRAARCVSRPRPTRSAGTTS